MATDVTVLLEAAVALLGSHRRELDLLNVFPVPDADTGANVLATVTAALDGARAAAPGEEAAGAVDGAVRGARGNSGVLLSQVLRGLLGHVATGLDARALAEGLAEGSRLAREAVAEPVEGSLLSAADAAADAAGRAAAGGLQLAARAAADAAHEAVERTPSQLDVLARAGVVDAGARALALLLEAVAAAVAGTAPSPPAVDLPVGGPAAAGCGAGDGRWEVMYVLEGAAPAAAAALRDELRAVGASVVVVEGAHVLQVHVHTDDIGAAVEVGVGHGTPRQVRVEDLAGAAPTPRLGAPVVLVGVAPPGLVDRLARAGAVVVGVAGDRAPLVVDVLDAAARITGDTVVVLPGNAALARVARDAAAVSAAEGGRALAVVDEAVSAPAVLAALATVVGGPVVDDLRLAAGAVRVAGVTGADAGGWVAVEQEHGELGTHQDVVAALDEVLDLLGDDGAPELVQVHLGTAAHALPDGPGGLLRAVAARWPDAEVERVDGGDPDWLVQVGAE